MQRKPFQTQLTGLIRRAVCMSERWGDRWGVQGGRRNSQWAPHTNYFGDSEILKDLKNSFQFTLSLDVCLHLRFDLTFGKQTHTKHALVFSDKSEMLLEGCLLQALSPGSVYRVIIFWTNTLSLPKGTQPHIHTRHTQSVSVQVTLTLARLLVRVYSKCDLSKMSCLKRINYSWKFKDGANIFAWWWSHISATLTALDIDIY